MNDKPVHPTWSIQADKVVQDKKKRIIYYRNAVIRVFGAPVMYLPVFWHADPKAERQSGLLEPTASLSDRRGFSYEQPYLLVRVRISTYRAGFLQVSRFITARNRYNLCKSSAGVGSDGGQDHFSLLHPGEAW